MTWVNEEERSHQLVSLSSNVIDSPLIGQAGTYTRSFSGPGEISYYCNIHNFMKGTVTVR